MNTVTGLGPVLSRCCPKILRDATVRKYIVSITGLFLIIFADIHATLNIPILKEDPASYGNMVRQLHDLWGLRFLEWMLVLAFSVHAVVGISLASSILWDPKQVLRTDLNIRHKGVWARVKNQSSLWMVVMGLYLICFMAFHVVGLKQHGPHDLYGQLVLQMQNPLTAFAYWFAALALGFHLIHGVKSVVLMFAPWPWLAGKATWVLVIMAAYPVVIFMIIPIQLHYGGAS